MREIKFRAWDRIEKKMRYGFDVGFFMSHENCEPFQQYTGLKDKNGREIYLSDFIQNKEGILLVVWSDKFASFGLDKKGWAFLHYFGEAIHPLECEVIGNLYENPELLK